MGVDICARHGLEKVGLRFTENRHADQVRPETNPERVMQDASLAVVPVGRGL